MSTVRFALAPTTCCPPDAGIGIWVDGESLIHYVADWKPVVGERWRPQPDGQYVWCPPGQPPTSSASARRACGSVVRRV